MKKYLSVLLVVFIILTSGCSSNKNIDLPYSIEQAYANNNVVDVLNGNKAYNVDGIEKFMSSVKNGERAKIRIVRYHWGNAEKLDFDNPTHILDLEFDGKKISFILYNVHSEGKLTKGKYEAFEKMDKVVAKDDVSYILLSSNDEKSHNVLSILNKGHIDNEAQKEIDSRLSKK